jgi:hypothetical protein
LAPVYFTEPSKDRSLLICVKVARSGPSTLIIVIAEQSKQGCCALAAIPSMLPPEMETREKGYDLIKQVLGARGELSAEDKKRMSEVARLFELEDGGTRTYLREVPKKPQAKAS